MISNEETINIYGINYPVIIKKSKNNRKIIFRFYDGIIHVSAPSYSTKKTIINTMNDLKDKLKSLIDNSKKKEVTFNNFDDILFFGKEYIIVYAEKAGFNGNRIYLNKDNPKESYFNLAKKYGQKFFQERINYYLSIIEPKLELKELKIRNMVSRYGDCYPKRKTITLNTKLAYYNIEQIDSVIVHELIHLIYPNHSKEFYAKVLEYCPNYYILKKQMDGVNLR